jgi:hypothetical protein
VRKTLQLLSIAIAVAVIGLSGFAPSNRASADSRECSNRMSEETSRYIKEMNIPLKGADAEFYSGKAEQVYLLNSEETLNPGAGRPVRNTVAVINHKDADGRSNFYVVEQEVRPGEVSFLLKKDSKLVQTLPVQLNLPDRSFRLAQAGPGVGCQPSSCNAINQAEAAVDANMAALANKDCRRVSYCVQHCSCFAGAMGVAQVIKYVDPTSRNCWVRDVGTYYASAHFWRAVSESSLLAQALDAAIKKEVRLYTLQRETGRMEVFF